MDFRFIQPLAQTCFIVLLTISVWVLTSNQSAAQDKWVRQMKTINSRIAAPFEIDERIVEASGIRKISSQHITLYTDVPSDSMIDELPEVFDQAIDQWCTAFGIQKNKAKNWKMRGYLIADPSHLDKFRKAGLAPNDLPEFKAGYQRGHDLWLFLQPGQYYTRHLLIHEGTHAFMQWFHQGYGPAWYSEGMSELYGVHRWEDKKLEIGYRLRDRNEADYWGRVKRIKDERDTENALSLDDVMLIPPGAFKDVRYYAWSWAGCKFLQNHPVSKDQFSKLINQTTLHYENFNGRFRRKLADQWPQLQRDWLIYINEIEYGYQVERGVMTKIVERELDQPLKKSFQLKTDHGWQLTSISLKKGDRVMISPSGQFRIGQSIEDGETTPWPCEANGVTLEYYQRRPLGVLLAGIMDPDQSTTENQVRGLLKPISIGNGSEFTATQNGVLCLRINESPSMLDDNDGTLEVSVEKLR